MILYFSGTGNSQYIARKIAKETGDALYSINEWMKEKKFFSDKTKERIIFVTPTYAWRIPKVVEQWILRSAFAEGVHAYFVLTCGGAIGNAGKYAEKLCAKKKFQYMGCAEVVMPENYIAMFSAPEDAEAKRIIEQAEPKIDEIIQKIQCGESLEKKAKMLDRVLSGPVNVLFYPAFVHAEKFRADETCVGCGKCAKLCPLDNIKLTDGKPEWGKKCTHCMACISSCPVSAIEYGKKSVGQPRYRCPHEGEEA